ncbi:hypothetical protein [Hymenobacter perfusus]|uniref:DUF4175 domain-containing protein n=1 Tax=Hymenobacter perfusus TaxID=1236770 RepID=A0A3R9MN56_9BACT|nr:hypothetical protein [Hymenobacter perfusus]RSK44396.1 hypothetical protein EI293_07650 [Hymenobacter perfusus]
MNFPFPLLISAVAYALLLVVIYKGSLSSSAFFIPVLAAVSALVLGGLFKLQHWAGAAELLIGGGTLLIVFYAIWNTRKKQRQRLDWLKLSYGVALGFSGISLGIGWRLGLPWLGGLLQATMWAIILDFVYVTYIRRSTQPPTA